MVFQPNPSVIMPAAKRQKAVFAADAFFDFDKSVMIGASRGKLDDLFTNLQDINLEVILSIGHSDPSEGTLELRKKIGMARAEAVKAYLVSKGIEARRIYTESSLNSLPTAPAKNRRVEIEAVGTKFVN